jgi:hypothetical protein
MDRLGKRGGPEGDEEDYFEEALDQVVEGRQEEELIIMKTILAWLQHCWICMCSAREDTREKDKASKELNLRRLEIILQHGNEEQKDTA